MNAATQDIHSSLHSRTPITTTASECRTKCQPLSTMTVTFDGNKESCRLDKIWVFELPPRGFQLATKDWSQAAHQKI